MYIKKNDGSDAIVEIGAGNGEAVWNSYDYTATSSQTSFSGSDNNSETLSYVPNFLQVFLNGILLDPAVDYAATTGNSIVLTVGATTSDLIQIETFTQIIGTGDILVDTFPVSSTQTAFTLSQDPINKSNISVYVEGVYQESSTYSLSGTTLTLSESPANGTTVEVVIGTRNVTLDGIVDLTISGTLHAGALDLGDANIINVNEISLDTIKGDADANTNITFAGNDVTTFTQGGQERLRLNTTGAEVTGNIVVSGNVDGRDVAADGVTADAALPRTGGAMGGAITTNSTFDGRDVSVDGTKLDTIEVSATADQTDVEIRAAVESASDSNVFTNADHSKLDAIEALADVTDATNVTAAGALMRAGGTMTGNLSLGDNIKAQFGNQTNGDLQIYHDGNNSRVEDKGTGGLRLIGSNFVSMQSDSGENMVVGTANSDVTLYHDNVAKIATTSTGINVTGSVVADGLTVDGGAQFNTGAAGVAEFYHTSGLGGLRVTGSASGSASTIFLSNDKSGTPFDIYSFWGNGSDDSLEFFSGGSPTTGTKRLKLANNGDISFYEDTGTTPKMVWDSSQESLGIGCSPSYPLEVQFGGVGTVLRAGTAFVSIDSVGSEAAPSLIFNGDSNTGFWRAASDTLAVSTGGTERMRIDSSGNLMVGATDDAPGAGNTVTGISLRGGTDNRSFFSVNQNYVMHLNRKGNSGNILEFAQDGTGVGSISVNSGYLGVGAGAVYLGYYTSGSTKSIIPMGNSTGGAAVGAIDLGLTSANHKFKDLYLSSTAYAPLVVTNDIKATGSGGISFQTDEGTKRLEISDAGEVGIGLGVYADPRLKIKSAAGGDPAIHFDGSAANRGAQIKFLDNGSLAGGFIDYHHNGDKMKFGAGSSATPTMTVGDQVVGIGTDSPAATLDVAGTALVENAKLKAIAESNTQNSD